MFDADACGLEPYSPYRHHFNSNITITNTLVLHRSAWNITVHALIQF